MPALTAERMKGGLHVPTEGVEIDFLEALKCVVHDDVARQSTAATSGSFIRGAAITAARISSANIGPGPLGPRQFDRRRG